MEIKTIPSFLDYYGKLRSRTNRLLETVQPEHLDFAYKHGKFTVADQIRHIAAIERYLFAEVVAGRKSRYSGCGYNLADGLENILFFFDQKHRESLEIFATLSDKDLHKKCITPDGSEITVWKWLRALTEHEIHHRAQLYLYLNMQDVKTPPIFGLTAEELEAKNHTKAIP